MDILRTRNSVSSLYVHLVFVTKYRKAVFGDDSLTTAKKVFESVCSEAQATLVEFNGEDNHVHLLVKYPPKLSIGDLVQKLFNTAEDGYFRW